MSTDIDVYPLFPTPLYKTNLDRNNDDILNYSKFAKFKFLECVKNGYVSENVYVLNTPELRTLSGVIQNNINFFVYDVLGVERHIQFYITNSWIMKHEKNHWAQEHHHDNCLLTGIYYFDVMENSGDINFIQNNMSSLFSPLLNIPYSKDTLFNTKKNMITPKNSDLIMFPSHLRHSVEQNKNNNHRYCLVFNAFIRGTLGNDKHFNRIDFK